MKPLALLLATAFSALLASAVFGAPSERASGPTRIVFTAGQAPQCQDHTCRPSRDVVRAISPHGTHLRKLAEIRSVVEISATDDGKRVAILSKIVAGAGAGSAPYTQIYLLSPGGKLREVFAQRIEGFNATGLAIREDGGLLALAGRGRRADGFPAESKIFLVRPSGAIRRLTTGPGQDDTPAFSPNGKRVVFTRTTGGNSPATRDSELYVVGIAGGAGSPLTDNSINDINPVFSPNGKQIAFGQFNRRASRLAVIGANGGNERTIINIGAAFPDPDYSPNGRNLVYVGELKGQPGGFREALFTVRASGERKRLVLKRFQSPDLPQWTEIP